MGGVFDKLQGEIDSRSAKGGMSILDLRDLHSGLRKIILRMIRQDEPMKYSEICEAMDAMPEAERMSRSELDQALEQLTKQGWLIRLGEERISYRAKLKIKAGSTLAQGIWNALDTRIEESKSAHKPGDEKPDE